MNKQLIGAIHFPPMPGYPENPGFEVALNNALADLQALEEGGMNMIIIENNYDIPHKEKISPEAVEEMIRLGKEISNKTNLPIGVSVLWNDFESAFKIAKAIGGTFIRVPVFVDRVKTSYGIMDPKFEEVLEARKKLDCNDVKIYADIHVKHSEIISEHTITESAEMAIEKGADVLIVTGKWTGDSPDLNDLIEVKKVSADTPVICGSGVSAENIKQLFEIADGAIVSTSLKEDTAETHEQNVKPYDVRISKDKVSVLTQSL